MAEPLFNYLRYDMKWTELPARTIQKAS